jgi:hypothetical protein
MKRCRWLLAFYFELLLFSYLFLIEGVRLMALTDVTDGLAACISELRVGYYYRPRHESAC